jgi:hypothetical protein
LSPAGARPTEERVTSDDRDLVAGPRRRRRKGGTELVSGNALGEFRGNPYKNFSIGNSPQLGG